MNKLFKIFINLISASSTKLKEKCSINMILGKGLTIPVRHVHIREAINEYTDILNGLITSRKSRLIKKTDNVLVDTWCINGDTYVDDVSNVFIELYDIYHELKSLSVVLDKSTNINDIKRLGVVNAAILELEAIFEIICNDIDGK